MTQSAVPVDHQESFVYRSTYQQFNSIVPSDSFASEVDRVLDWSNTRATYAPPISNNSTYSSLYSWNSFVSPIPTQSPVSTAAFRDVSTPTLPSGNNHHHDFPTSEPTRLAHSSGSFPAEEGTKALEPDLPSPSCLVVEIPSIIKRSRSQSPSLSDIADNPDNLVRVGANIYSQASPPSYEVPLRTTHTCRRMRQMMGVFRLNPFNIPGSRKSKKDTGYKEVVLTWTGEEAKAHDREPEILEWQLDGYDSRSSTPGDEIRPTVPSCPTLHPTMCTFSSDEESEVGAGVSDTESIASFNSFDSSCITDVSSCGTGVDLQELPCSGDFRENMTHIINVGDQLTTPSWNWDPASAPSSLRSVGPDRTGKEISKARLSCPSPFPSPSSHTPQRGKSLLDALRLKSNDLRTARPYTIRRATPKIKSTSTTAQNRAQPFQSDPIHKANYRLGPKPCNAWALPKSGLSSPRDFSHERSLSHSVSNVSKERLPSPIFPGAATGYGLQVGTDQTSRSCPRSGPQLYHRHAAYNAGGNLVPDKASRLADDILRDQISTEIVSEDVNAAVYGFFPTPAANLAQSLLNKGYS